MSFFYKLKLNKKIVCIILFVGILSLRTFSARAQVPIEQLVSKYKDIEQLKTFSADSVELKLSKQISLNLNEKERKLILGTEEQYTLLYNGGNPSLITFFNEANAILKANGFVISIDQNTDDGKSITYTLTSNNTVKEIVKVTLSYNSVVILISKGTFDQSDYREQKN